MTRHDDIERILEHWLTDGPTRMPDRFLDDALDRIDRGPRRRRSRVGMRVLAGDPRRLVAAAAVILLVAGAGALAITRMPGVGVAPSLPPSAQVGDASVALQGSWSSVGVRQPPVGCCPFRYDIVIGPATLKIPDFKADVLSSLSIVGRDRLEIHMLTTSVWECRVGDVGTYTFSLSSDGRTLTLAPVRDDCAARSAILAGQWTRTDVGDLEPGRHLSALFRPFGGAATGQLSYTVPTGWSEVNECDACLVLEPKDGAQDWHIDVYSNVVPRSYSVGDSCADAAAGIGPTPAAIAVWLSTLQGLIVTAPTPVAIGGLDGVFVDVSVEPGYVNRCSYSQSGGLSPGATDGPRIYNSPAGTFASPDESQALGLIGDDWARYFILDRGDGRVLVIAIVATTSTSATTDAEAMPIIQSFEFTR
jgi:hypothetical protein